MNKTFIISTVAAITALTLGCAPEETTSTSRNTTLVIDSSNAKTLIGNSLEVTSAVPLNLEEINDEVNTYSGRTSASNNLSRASNTINENCIDSGTRTIVASIPDDLKTASSGTILISLTAANCVEEGLTINGNMTTSISLADINTNSPTGAATLTFNDYSQSSPEQSASADGYVAARIDSESYSISFDLYVSSSIVGNGVFRTSSTTAISGSHIDTYPSAGALRIDGAEGTYITAEIANGGIAVSVNGGQAVQYSWSDF